MKKKSNVCALELLRCDRALISVSLPDSSLVFLLIVLVVLGWVGVEGDACKTGGEAF